MNATFVLAVLSCCVLLAVSIPAVRDYNPCEHGSLMACEVYCIFHGHLLGSCDKETNECKCSGTYYNSARKEDPCVTGSLLGCEIHCLVQGHLVGKCGADNVCECS